MNYPEMIKKYRDKEFLSQDELASLLGVTNVTVNRWENGKFEPAIKCKRKLHDLFVEAKLIKENLYEFCKEKRSAMLFTNTK